MGDSVLSSLPRLRAEQRLLPMVLTNRLLGNRLRSSLVRAREAKQRAKVVRAKVVRAKVVRMAQSSVAKVARVVRVTRTVAKLVLEAKAQNADGVSVGSKHMQATP